MGRLVHGARVCSLRLGSIVEALGGELRGDAERLIEGLAPLESAGPGELSFLSNPRYAQQLASSRAGCVIVAPSQRDAALAGATASSPTDPYLYFARLTQLWKQRSRADSRARRSIPAPSSIPMRSSTPRPASARCAWSSAARTIGAGTC